MTSTPTERAWRDEYARVCGELPRIASEASRLLCGFSTSVDVRIPVGVDELAEIERMASSPGERASALAGEIVDRIMRGRGGEIPSDEGGLDWLGDFASGEAKLGGTGAHVARAYAQLGAPAALVVGDQSRDQLACIPHEIPIIGRDGTLRSAAEIEPRGATQAPVFVLDLTAGLRTAHGLEVTRSTRIIVTQIGRRLDFVDEAQRFAQRTHPNGMLVSGFQTMDPAAWDAARDWIHELAGSVGAFRHHEVAEYRSRAFFEETVRSLAPVVPSLGMSMSELGLLVPGSAPPAERASALARELGLNRVCVHADGAVFSVTTGDPERERDALLAGCLLASNRATGGERTDLSAAPADDATYDADLLDAIGRGTGRHRVVAVVAPYSARPRTTLGLGDTFVAGTSLVLNTSN